MPRKWTSKFSIRASIFSSRSLSLSLPHFPVAFIGFETPTKTQVKVDFKVLKLNETLFSKKEKRLRKIHRKKENFNFFLLFIMSLWQCIARIIELCFVPQAPCNRLASRGGLPLSSRIFMHLCHTFRPVKRAKAWWASSRLSGATKQKNFLMERWALWSSKDDYDDAFTHTHAAQPMRFSSLINSKCSQSEDGSLPPSRVTITGPALEKSFSIPTREGDFGSADGRPLLTITLCKEAYNLIEEKVEKRPVCYTFYTNTTIDEGRKKKVFGLGNF